MRLFLFFMLIFNVIYANENLESNLKMGGTQGVGCVDFCVDSKILNVAFLDSDSKNTNSKKIESNKINTSVSIAPLAFFVKEIAKDRANVAIIVPQNKNPESYEPDFNSMQIIAKSSLIIGIGMPFEKIWIPKILNSSDNKDIKILELDKLLQNNIESHLWLSLENAEKIANIIANTFIEIDSKNANFYKENLANLLDSIRNLKLKIPQILKNMPKKDFIVFHPLFEGFTQEYGLQERSLEQHGKKYGVKDIINLANLGKEKGIKRVFSQQNNRDMQTLADSIKARVIVVDPLSEDYLKNLESIITEISKSYNQ